METRHKGGIVNIDYEDTKDFFKQRASRYNEENPYNVTMYQDGNMDLVKERNRQETERLIPLMRLNKDTKLLDIACGIGRWADAINCDIEKYCGIDYSEELIEIAKKRVNRNFASFYTGGISEIKQILTQNKEGLFNTFLLVGILMYLNDNDVDLLFTQINEVCQDNAIICIREPIAFDERLTLKNFYSEELKHDYNAIYRTKDEFFAFFERNLYSRGFELKEEGFVSKDGKLNNRKETAHYYFVLEK